MGANNISNEFIAGVSIENISPKKGIELAGYPHYLRKNIGIHDHLYGSCIFLSSKGKNIFLVCLDTLMLSKKYIKIICKNVSEKLNVLEKDIIISSSHSHSSPWTSGMLDLEALKNNFEPDHAYLDELIYKVTNLIINASNNQFDAKIGFGCGNCGKEKGIGGNRINPNGPADTDVWVIGLKDSEDNLKACLVNYALHPTVLHEDNNFVSADYPGYIREYFAESNPDAVFLFSQGASGNQSTRYFRKGQSFEEAKRIGYEIGKEAIKILEKMTFSDEITLDIFSTETELILRELPSIEIAQDKLKILKEKYDYLKNSNASYIDIQNAYLNYLGAEDLLGYVLLKEKRWKLSLLEDEVPAEIFVLKINGNIIVCLPGEIFVEFALEIKAKSPFKNTMVFELSNGCLPGYTCTKDAFNNSGYESSTTLLSYETGENFVSKVLDILNSL